MSTNAQEKEATLIAVKLRAYGKFLEAEMGRQEKPYLGADGVRALCELLASIVESGRHR